MEKKIIQTNKAPQAIGPYSQGIQITNFANLFFFSGQVALSPEGGELVAQDIQGQTKQVMQNIQQVLEAADLKFNNVIKTTIFLKDLGDFTIVNEIYAGYFKEQSPARATVEVSRLPKDALVEIEVIAAK